LHVYRPWGEFVGTPEDDLKIPAERETVLRVLERTATH